MRSLYNDPIFGTKLICEFMFNQGVGDYARDSSLYFDQAQLMNDAGADPSWASVTELGKPIMTLDFTNKSYCDIGTGTQWDLLADADEITIEMVALCDTVAALNMLFASDVPGVGAGAAFPQLFVDTTPNLCWRPTRDGDTDAQVLTSISGGEWFHVVCTYSSSDTIGTIILNGATEVTDTIQNTTTISAPSAKNVYVGTRWNTNSAAFENFLDGHIALLRVWYRRLEYMERMTLYNRAKTKFGL